MKPMKQMTNNNFSVQVSQVCSRTGRTSIKTLTLEEAVAYRDLSLKREAWATAIQLYLSEIPVEERPDLVVATGDGVCVHTHVNAKHRLRKLLERLTMSTLFTQKKPPTSGKRERTAELVSALVE